MYMYIYIYIYISVTSGGAEHATSANMPLLQSSEGKFK